jgi:Ca-activated chloride channel family protein
VHVLWARRKIAALMDKQRDHARDPAIRQAVIKTALTHHLASRYTSLVAVDVTPARPQSDGLESTAVPTNLPAGWKHDKVFGRLPGTATPARAQMLVGVLAIAIAAFLLVGFRRGRHDA